MFSCCCARVDLSWSPVCDCYAGGYKCEQTCLEDALIAESVYATVGTASLLSLSKVEADISRTCTTTSRTCIPMPRSGSWGTR